MNEGYHRIPSFNSSRNFQRNNQITDGSDACLQNFQMSSVKLSSKKGNVSDHRRSHSHTTTIKCDQLDKALDEDKMEPSSFGIPNSKTKTSFQMVLDNMKNSDSSVHPLEKHCLKHCNPKGDGANLNRNIFKTPKSLNFEFSRRAICHPSISDGDAIDLMRNRSPPRSGRKSSRKLKSTIGLQRPTSERKLHKSSSLKKLTKSSNKHHKSCTLQKHSREAIVQPSLTITKFVLSDDEKSELETNEKQKSLGKVNDGLDEIKTDDGVVVDKDKVQMGRSFQERLSQGSLNGHKKVRTSNEDKKTSGKVNGLSKVACETKQPSTINKSYLMQSDKKLNRENGIRKESSQKCFLNNSLNMTCKKLKTSKKCSHKSHHSRPTNKYAQFEPYREVNLLWSKKCLSETRCSDLEPGPDLDIFKKCNQLKSKSKSIQRKVFGSSRDYIEGCLHKYHSWCQKSSGHGCDKPKVQRTQIYQSYPIFPNYSTMQSYGCPCTQSYRSFCHCASRNAYSAPRNRKTVSGSSRVSVDHHDSDSSSENFPDDVEIDLCYAPRYCCCMTCQNALTVVNPDQVAHASIEKPLTLDKSGSIADSFCDVIKDDFRRVQKGLEVQTEDQLSDKLSMLKNLDERFAEVFDDINIPDNKSYEKISDTFKNNSLEALRRRCCDDMNSSTPNCNNCENTCVCAINPIPIVAVTPRSSLKKIKIMKNNLADCNLNTCRNNNAVTAAENLNDDCIISIDHPGMEALSFGMKAESTSEIKLDCKVNGNQERVSGKVGREMLKEKQLSKYSGWTSLSDYKVPSSELVMGLLDNQKFETKDYSYPNSSSWCESASIIYGNILIPKLDLSFLNDEVSDRSQRLISGHEHKSFNSKSSSTSQDNIYEESRIEDTKRSAKSAKKLISDNFIEPYHDSNNMNQLDNSGIRSSGNARKENLAEQKRFPNKCYNQSNSNILPDDSGSCQGNNSLFPKRNDFASRNNNCAIALEPKHRSRFSMLPHFYSSHKDNSFVSSNQAVQSHNEVMITHVTNKSEVSSIRKVNKSVQNTADGTTGLHSYFEYDVHNGEHTEIRERIHSDIRIKGGSLSESVRTNNADIQNNLPAARSRKFSLINEGHAGYENYSSHPHKSEKTIKILQKVKDKLLMEGIKNKIFDDGNLKSSRINGFGGQMSGENEADESKPLIKKSFDLEGAKMHIRKLFDKYR